MVLGHRFDGLVCNDNLVETEMSMPSLKEATMTDAGLYHCLVEEAAPRR